jgi:hypothetical protein
MKLLVDAVLVFLVMLVAASLMAWVDTGESSQPPTTQQASGGLAEASLPSLLGLR